MIELFHIIFIIGNHFMSEESNEKLKEPDTPQDSSAGSEEEEEEESTPVKESESKRKSTISSVQRRGTLFIPGEEPR